MSSAETPQTQNGLAGRANIIANMSAVGFVLVLLLYMYSDFSASVKADREMTREEFRENRRQIERLIESNNNVIRELKRK